MPLIRKNKKKVRFFSFAGIWSKKKHKSKKLFSSTKPDRSRKLFETTKQNIFQQNFLKLLKKSFFSKIFIFTYFFRFFTMSLIRKNKKKVRFFRFAGVCSQKKHKSKKLFETTKEKFF
jgi:hypothetical protein